MSNDYNNSIYGVSGVALRRHRMWTRLVVAWWHVSVDRILHALFLRAAIAANNSNPAVRISHVVKPAVASDADLSIQLPRPTVATMLPFTAQLTPLHGIHYTV